MIGLKTEVNVVTRFGSGCRLRRRRIRIVSKGDTSPPRCLDGVSHSLGIVSFQTVQRITRRALSSNLKQRDQYAATLGAAASRDRGTTSEMQAPRRFARGRSAALSAFVLASVTAAWSGWHFLQHSGPAEAADKADKGNSAGRADGGKGLAVFGHD